LRQHAGYFVPLRGVEVSRIIAWTAARATEHGQSQPNSFRLIGLRPGTTMISPNGSGMTRTWQKPASAGPRGGPAPKRPSV